ncbi:VOC family protein [Methylobacterium nonmethylotrophicum]|uniref:VOC family protein n=1 Tax=Methylobacterium nonmethylotrophicum TaxID=1141884 RepID=UPI00315CC00F
MRRAHVALRTRDLDAATGFWRTWFGAEIGEPSRSRRRHGFVSRFAPLASGAGIEPMTGPWAADGAKEAGGSDPVAIPLGSEAAVDAMADRCARAGILSSGPRRTGDGFYEAVITMPDGTPVEITARRRAAGLRSSSASASRALRASRAGLACRGSALRHVLLRQGSCRFAGVRGRSRLRALTALSQATSPAELNRSGFLGGGLS